MTTKQIHLKPEFINRTPEVTYAAAIREEIHT